jgi:DNA repair protein RadC
MNSAPSLFPEYEPPKKKENPYSRLQVVRVALVKERPVIYNTEKLTTPAQVAEAFRALFGDIDREAFVLFLLDGKNRIVSCNVVTIGSLNQCIVHPREVFKPAILANAAAIILAHNHPTGDPHPSPEDMAITRRIKEGGELLGIKVMDHIIIGDNCHLSFSERGYL